MKKILLISAFALSSTFLFAQSTVVRSISDAANSGETDVASYEPMPQINFEQKSHEFGKIKQGDVVEHIFSFTNTGEANLVLTNVRPSCGCTSPRWTKEAVAPGETGEIKVIFNSRGKFGPQRKSVYVEYKKENSDKAPLRETLFFTGTIETETTN